MGCSSPANPPAAISTNNQQVAIASHSSDGACSVVTEAQQLTTEGSQGIITTHYIFLQLIKNTLLKLTIYFPLLNDDVVTMQEDEQLIPQGEVNTSRCSADNDVNMEQQGEAQGKNTNALVLRTLEMFVHVVHVFMMFFCRSR